MEKPDVVYFSVNNWFCGENYPPTENFKKWLGDDLKQNFRNDEWCKENKLCVYWGNVDMSLNYTVSAPKEWVEKNCPELLTEDEFTYYTVTMKPRKKKLFGMFGDHTYGYDRIKEEHKKKYSDFVYTPETEEDDTPDDDRIGNMPFRYYCEENFGSAYYQTDYWDDYDEDEGEDEDGD